MPLKGQRSAAGERTRTAILEATIRILGRDGPNRLSASALARETDVSKATIFHHFRSIEEIPIAAMERYWIQALAAKVKDAASARGYLLQLGSQILDLPRKRATFLKAHVVFLVKAMFDPRLHARLAASAEAMHGRLATELAVRLPRARRKDEAEVAARMVEMMLDGLLLGMAAVESPRARVSSRRAWMRFVNILLKELAS